MRFWFDTEFQDDGRIIHLISIGVVAEDGLEYYAEAAEYDWSRADDWLRANVLPQLNPASRKVHSQIRAELKRFFSVGGPPEFWADCGEYDWMVLRQLLGTQTQWPQYWPYLAMDIEQWRIRLGAPAFLPQQTNLHNALEDARNCRQRWEWLKKSLRKNPVLMLAATVSLAPSKMPTPNFWGKVLGSYFESAAIALQPSLETALRPRGLEDTANFMVFAPPAGLPVGETMQFGIMLYGELAQHWPVLGHALLSRQEHRLHGRAITFNQLALMQPGNEMMTIWETAPPMLIPSSNLKKKSSRRYCSALSSRGCPR